VHKDCKFISEYRSYISDDSSVQCQPRERLKAHNYVTTYSLIQHTFNSAHIKYTRAHLSHLWNEVHKYGSIQCFIYDKQTESYRKFQHPAIMLFHILQKIISTILPYFPKVIK